MTSTISNQEKKSPRDGQKNHKIGAVGFIVYLKQKLVSFISSKGKDGHRENTSGAETPLLGILKKPGRPPKTEDGGTRRLWKRILSLFKRVESSQETNDVKTSTQTQPEKSEFPKTPVRLERKRHGHPSPKDDGGTP